IYSLVMDAEELFRSCLGFQWDAGNSNKNWITHRVLTFECEQMFFNQPLVAAEDAAHSQHEQRFFALGQTDDGRRLCVAFTIRGHLIRVVSARDMSRKERTVYGDAEKKNS
ncbi:MAG TPA: BrnT family toxin, partial [Elusimicrobiota bacterium]|nr:BrnT family toxin [Elusimicrobiota bacterium]